MKLSLSDQTAILVLGNGLSRAVRFAAGLALPYLMVQSDFGVYQQVWVIYSILESFLCMGWSEAVVYHWPRLEGRTRAGMVWRLHAMLAALGVLLAGCLVAGSPWLATWYGTPRLQGDLSLFALYALFSFPTLAINSILLSAGRTRTVAVLAAASTALETAAVLVPLALGLGLTEVLWALAVYAVLRFGACAALAWSATGPGWEAPGALSALTWFSLPLAMPKALQILEVYLDRLILGFYLPAAAFAVYGRGATRLPFVPILSSSALSVVQVGLARCWKDRDVPGFLDLWHESIRKVALVILPMFFFFLAFGAPLYRLAFPPEYAAGAMVFWLYVFLLPLSISANSHILVLLGMPVAVTRQELLLLVPGVLLTWASVHWLLPVLGLAAPALATVVFWWAGWFFLLRLVRLRLGVSWGQVYPWWDMAAISRWGAAAAGAGLAAYALAGELWPADVPGAVPAAWVAACLAFGAVYAYGLFAGGLLRTEDRELIGTWLQGGPFRARTVVEVTVRPLIVQES